jgi:predicted nicotinamide N-methyase
MDAGDIEVRFGLRVRTHRIRDLALRIAEVERVDDMVSQVYPDAVTDHGDAPVWMITWPAALALAEHVVDEGIDGARVLELGCGTAAPGIAARLAGARVTCTDHDPLALALARHNAQLNGCEDIAFGTLDWFHPSLEGRFDVVVGSEIVYFEKTFPALLAVLARYAAPGGRILLADQGRPQMETFLRLCARACLQPRLSGRTVHLSEESRRIRIVSLHPHERQMW